MAQVPFVIEKTANGERSMDIGSRLLQDRIIVLGESVNEVTATLIIEQMLFLEHANPNREICFYIKSPGGSVSDGLAIYDTMQYIKCDVRTICMGMAASMGAFLLAGGTKGKRMILPNAEVMIHQPSGGTQGQASDLQISAEHILKLKSRLNKIMAKNTGHTEEEIERLTDRDNWLSAEEALELNIVDEIIKDRQ